MKRHEMRPELVSGTRRSHEMEESAHGSSDRSRPLCDRKCATRLLVLLIRRACERSINEYLLQVYNVMRGGYLQLNSW